MTTRWGITRFAEGAADWPQSEVLLRGRSHLTAGEANWAEAQLLSLDPSNLLQDDSITRFVRMSLLGEVYHQQGRLHLAAAIYQPLLDQVDEQPLNTLLFHFFDQLCRLYYEWNQLGKARQYYHWCLSTIEQHHLPPIWSLPSLIGLAWALWAGGMSQAANQQLHKAALLVQHTQQPGLNEQINIQRARLWIHEGNLSGAARLLKAAGGCCEDASDYQQLAAQLTQARLLIRQKQSERALRLLQVHEQMALNAGRECDLIEILVLQALAHASQADSANASAALANALCRAEREGFVRTFVDEGVEMMALLQQSAAQGITLLYVHDLLAAFSAKIAQPSKTLQTDRPIEPLSRRELEVLRFVAAGASNDEIASHLTISPATVKKHLGNILGKLHVKNRTQAAARARELALI